ncbi:MAG: response regulator transcription factor [Lachnospiraceae bacterium]|nr:response regulator transcription factor [Lachnospiraceae bacterium]
MKKTILALDKGAGMISAIKPLLEGEGIRTVEVSSFEELYKKYQKISICLMLVNLDIEKDGMGKEMELLVRLRRLSSVPIIVISGQAAETAKIMALNAGADDYVTMDCNPLELFARIKSQLRRYVQLVKAGEQMEQVYRTEGLEVNDLNKTVYVEGRDVRLTPIEYKILRLLMQKRGKVLSIDEIYESIWNAKAVGVDNTVAVHIRHIREKIEENPKEPRYLKVVWGSGYKVV